MHDIIVGQRELPAFKVSGAGLLVGRVYSWMQCISIHAMLEWTFYDKLTAPLRSAIILVRDSGPPFAPRLLHEVYVA